MNRGVEFKKMIEANKELEKFEIDTKIYTEEPVYKKRELTSDTVSNVSPKRDEGQETS